MFTKVIALAILVVAAARPQSDHGSHTSGASYITFALNHGGGSSGGLSGGGHSGGGLGEGLGAYRTDFSDANGGSQGYGHDEHYIDYHAYPKYEYQYGVADSHTHDHHSHREVRDGDVVKGEYSLHEPDGTVRIVKYTADKKNGFNAQVIRQGHAVHPETTHKGQFALYGSGHEQNGH